LDYVDGNLWVIIFREGKMFKTPPTPSDLCYALLVSSALKHSKIGKWLAQHCFMKSFDTLKQLMDDYLDRIDGLDCEDHIYRLEQDFLICCDSPDALEDTLEILSESLSLSPTETEEYIMGEEKFGLIIRNVTRIAVAGNFEELCRLYDACVKFAKPGNESSIESDHDITMLDQSHVTSASSAVNKSMLSSFVSTHPNFMVNRRGKWYSKDDRDFQTGVGRLETRQTVELLHSFFDHASRRTTVLCPPTHPFVESLRVEGHPNRKSVFMQHAILELASVHHALGNDREAFLAAREAVCVSQQNLDEKILEESLNLFRRLDEKAKLFSSTMASKSEQGRLERAKEIMLGTGYSGQSGKRPRAIWRELDGISEETYLTRQAMMRSDAWEQFGHAALATSWTQTIVQDPSVSVEDRALALCRLGLVRFAKGKDIFDPKNDEQMHKKHPLEIIKQAMTILRNEDVEEDEVGLDESDIPAKAPSAFHSAVAAQIVATMLSLVHSSLIMEKRFRSAARIRYLCQSSGCGDTSHLFADERKAWGSYADAFSALSETQSSNLNQTNDIKSSKVYQANVLLKYSKLFKKERALSFALRAWSIGKELNLRNLCALALVQVARARMETGNALDAFQLIRKSKPQIAIHAPLADMREAELIEVKCRLHLKHDLKQIAHQLETLTEKLQTDETLYSKLLQESLYLLARVYNELGDIDRRDHVSIKFLESQEQGRSNQKHALKASKTDLEAFADEALQFASEVCNGV
jgi:hypothetical protein